jgi:hypothetical protein
MAVAHTCFLEPNLPVSPIAELATMRRASSSPLPGRRQPLGELPSLPAPVRVSALPPHARRKKMAGSH